MADSTSCRQASSYRQSEGKVSVDKRSGCQLLREGKLGRRTSVGRTRQDGTQLCREMAIRRRQVVVHKSNRVRCRSQPDLLPIS